jgi:hypothetical protein
VHCVDFYFLLGSRATTCLVPLVLGALLFFGKSTHILILSVVLLALFTKVSEHAKKQRSISMALACQADLERSPWANY